MRLGIDLDGVVANFNAGWTKLHRQEFGSDVTDDQVVMWDGLHHVGGFADMNEFWRWAEGGDQRPSIFRHLDVYPGAVETLHALDRAGHQVVIVTTKPDWARTDTLHWIADRALPTSEVHMTFTKHRVDCDVYLDDSPHVLQELTEMRPDSTVCRFIRPWNEPIAGALDVANWDDFYKIVTGDSSAG